MEKLGVVPDVIPTVPPKILKIVYADDVKVENGNTLTPTNVKAPPTISYGTDRGNFYTLIMTDPDAPKRKDQHLREWQHWVVVNIPCNNVIKGEVLTEYVGAAPAEGTGLHRYVFLLYRQPDKKEFDEPRLSKRTAKGRENFSTTNFIRKYNISDLIAGNFFQAEWDDYVPIIQTQLLRKKRESRKSTSTA